MSKEQSLGVLELPEVQRALQVMATLVDIRADKTKPFVLGYTAQDTDSGELIYLDLQVTTYSKEAYKLRQADIVSKGGHLHKEIE